MPTYLPRRYKKRGSPQYIHTLIIFFLPKLGRNFYYVEKKMRPFYRFIHTNRQILLNSHNINNIFKTIQENQ